MAMPLRSSKDGTGRRRYARRSTKSRLTVRPPRHPGRLIAIVCTVVLTVVVALIWGSVLDRRSEAYREQESARDWMLDEGITTPHPVAVPDVRAAAILPEQNTAPFLSDYGGILVPLRAPDGGLYFASEVADEAGILPVAPPLSDASGAGLSLTDEVHRIARRGLRVIATFTVTYPDAPDAATRAYRRGLELALLADYAASGMDDLLILGLPCGHDAADREAVAFVADLRALIGSLPKPPTVGCVLPLSVFRSDKDASAEGADPTEETEETPLYAGRLTPGRMAEAFDFVVLDLRAETVESAEALLPHLAYAYVRYSLRILVADGEVATVPIRHGLERVFEMPVDPPSDAT